MLNDLFNLHLFLNVAQCKSFSTAAKHFQLSPASVSQRIARLESELEVRLFQRTTRSVQLTEEGRVFFEQAARGLSILDHGVDLLKGIRGGAEGRMRITCCGAFGRHVLIPLIGRFLSSNPRIRIELSYSDPDDDMIKGGYDVAIRPRQSSCRNFISRQIYRTPLILVASPRYLAKKGTPHTPQDLAGHDWIRVVAHGTESAQHIDLVKIGDDGEPLAPPVRVEHASCPISIRQDMDCVEVGLCDLGISVLSPRTAAPMLQSGDLARVLPEYRLQRYSEYFIEYPHRDFLPYRTRAFVEFMVDMYRQSPTLVVDGL